MNIDFIRGVAAHLTASAVVLIGMVSLVWMIMSAKVPPEVGLPLLASIIAGAAGFIWGSETAKQASKQTSRDILQEPPEPPAGPPPKP